MEFYFIFIVSSMISNMNTEGLKQLFALQLPLQLLDVVAHLFFTPMQINLTLNKAVVKRKDVPTFNTKKENTLLFANDKFTVSESGIASDMSNSLDHGINSTGKYQASLSGT